MTVNFCRVESEHFGPFYPEKTVSFRCMILYSLVDVLFGWSVAYLVFCKRGLGPGGGVLVWLLHQPGSRFFFKGAFTRVDTFEYPGTEPSHTGEYTRVPPE